jgi:NACHT domain
MISLGGGVMADSGIDTSKLTTHVAQRAIDRVLDIAEGKVKEWWAQHKNKSKETFANYIQAQSQKCALVRTLIYDKQSAYLPDIYVPLRAHITLGFGRRAKKREVTTEDVIELLGEERDQRTSNNRKTSAISLLAPAGAGKTFFMRNLYLRLAASSHSKIPIFLEARELNRIPPTDFPSIIATAFHIAGQQFSKEQAIDGLKVGIFMILIDGFDELSLSHERHYASVLERAAHDFQLCPIMVSGRPSELLQGSFFEPCNLLPLDQKQSIELIQKQDFDEATKKSFIALMKKTLFESHAEFLELPLLCVVMLLTYSDSGRISSREHEFYEDAFNALWSKHDARKQAGYEREKYAGLDKSDFMKLLSAFCASSYVSEDFSMRESELNSHLALARKLTDVAAREQDFARDMTISTSLLVLEGNTYRFSHRSFQEYFCARYVLGLSDKEVEAGIQAVSTRYETDRVLDFVRSMNPERFETAWVLPRLSAVLPKLQKGEQSIRTYQRLFSSAEGEFLRKLREVYEMKPSSETLSGALAAWHDMELPDRNAVYDIEEIPQWKLILKDISNFEKLSEKLVKKYSTRSLVRKALFDSGNASTKAISKKIV